MLPSQLDLRISSLSQRLFESGTIYKTAVSSDSLWNYIFIVSNSPNSQYDALIEEIRNNNSLPGGILCLSVKSSGLHGFRNRKWEALLGNIHLSAYLRPEMEIAHYSTGFLILSAVSSLETIDRLPNLKYKSEIKWVNDVLIKGSKVCGVLAHTQAQGAKVTGAVLGIGLNVEASPDIIRDQYVPSASCINNYIDTPHKLNQRDVLKILIERISENYLELLNGNYKKLLNIYRERSCIINRKVSIWNDPHEGEPELTARGIVESIGDNLELNFKGRKFPITNGRLKFE